MVIIPLWSKFKERNVKGKWNGKIIPDKQIAYPGLLIKPEICNKISLVKTTKSLHRILGLPIFIQSNEKTTFFEVKRSYQKIRVLQRKNLFH